MPVANTILVNFGEVIVVQIGSAYKAKAVDGYFLRFAVVRNACDIYFNSDSCRNQKDIFT